MTITVTESAAKQIERQILKRGNGVGLRLGVKKSGCSGFAYTIEYADQIHEDDRVFDQGSVKVVISENDMPYLDGIEIDFRREGISEAFKFNNPNVKASCGCGESFSVGQAANGS